ncbi:unnamed protein product [Mytilus coruscus]|uniref:Uncharacterized protein n=1 Tax=Mytilus coruscus TaxID=42192 RepID=A0A6J8CS01_MYTCO|nr:unnamed protein product [Mytilus coruscus]
MANLQLEFKPAQEKHFLDVNADQDGSGYNKINRIYAIDFPHLLLTYYDHKEAMFSSSERFDMGSSRGDAYATDYDKNDKFSLKISTAFVLTLLAVAISVFVGLIVHFAGGNKHVTCQCSCPGDGSSTGGQIGCPEQTTLPNTCTPCSNSNTNSAVDMTTTEAPTPQTIQQSQTTCGYLQH